MKKRYGYNSVAANYLTLEEGRLGQEPNEEPRFQMHNSRRLLPGRNRLQHDLDICI